MAGYFVFDPGDRNIGFSTGEDLAVNTFLDILTDTLYYTDGSTIFEWEGKTNARKVYTWRSARHRFPKLVNLGAALVEAESYDNLEFRLYADEELKHTHIVRNADPFRLPGGYISNLYEVELVGTDVVTGVSIAENIFDLSAG